MSQSCTKQTKAKFGGEKPKDKEKLEKVQIHLMECGVIKMIYCFMIGSYL